MRNKTNDEKPVGCEKADIQSKFDGKVETRTRLNVVPFSKIVQFFDAKGNPVCNGGWGHECRFGKPSPEGITEIELLGVDGQPQRAGTRNGFSLSFDDREHFDKSTALLIRLTKDPLILKVGGVAKLVTYGDVQRAYDADGDELVLNRDNIGYILFVVRPDKKVLRQYFLANAHTLRAGPEGWAYAVRKYAADGSVKEERHFNEAGETQ
jgi:hypothetical protein